MLSMRRVGQGGEDRYSIEDVGRMPAGVVVRMSVKSLLAIFSFIQQTPWLKTELVRYYLHSVRRDHEALSEREFGWKRDRLEKQQAERTARRPTQGVVSVSHLVSRQHILYYVGYCAVQCAPTACPFFVRFIDRSHLVEIFSTPGRSKTTLHSEGWIMAQRDTLCQGRGEVA